MKKLLRLLFTFFLVLFLSACAGDAGRARKPIKNGRAATVYVTYLAVLGSAPQAHINQKHEIFASELKKLGKKVKFSSTQGLDYIWPIMDKKNSPEFLYLPIDNFSTYITEKSKIGGSNKYAVIAGSLNSNNYSLVTRPEIDSLKELDGKNVGIGNLRYSDEFQLNKALASAGLKTDSLGGTVKIGWDGIAHFLLQNYREGKYDAIAVSSNLTDKALSEVPGGKTYPLNPDGLFGKKQPAVWLVARKDVIKKDPELVKAVIRAHISSTAKAKSRLGSVPAIERETILRYFKARHADASANNPIERFEKKWREAEPTYDPNMDYLKGMWKFLNKRRLVKGKTIDDFVQVDLLNEVLGQMGKRSTK